jgi:hypothetical protein
MNLASVDRIHIPSLRAHLEKRGWVFADDQRIRVQAPDGKRYVVPSELTFEVQKDAIRLVLEALMVEDGLWAESEILERSRKTLDIMYFGCEFPSISPGLIRSVDAVHYYTNLTRYVREVTTLEGSTSKGRNANAYMNRIHFGEVIAGSYLVSVHLPIDGEPNALGRRVLNRAITSFDLLVESQEVGSAKPMTDDPETAWSPGMCDVIYNLIQETQATELKLIPRQDPVYPSAKKQDQAARIVSVESGLTDQVLLTAKSILVGLREEEYAQVEGLASVFTDLSVREDSQVRKVEIFWRRPGKKSISVIAHLSEDDYARALVNASKKQAIRVSGLLKQKGTRYVLEQPDQVSLFLDGSWH